MKNKDSDTTIRGAVIRKYITDLNGYMKNTTVSENNYDQIMNLYENDRRDIKVDMYFYTTKSGEEVFKLVGSKLTKNGLYRRSDDRLFDVNILFDYQLINLLLFIFLRDTMHITRYNYAYVTSTYRLSQIDFGKFYKGVLVYFL